MLTAIITSEGQTTIPEEIRELLGLHSGDAADAKLKGAEGFHSLWQ